MAAKQGSVGGQIDLKFMAVGESQQLRQFGMQERFAQDMQAEVKSPPQVTPPTASKFGSEFTRISQDVLFNRAKPDDGAKQIAQMATDLNK